MKFSVSLRKTIQRIILDCLLTPANCLLGLIVVVIFGLIGANFLLRTIYVTHNCDSNESHQSNPSPSSSHHHHYQVHLSLGTAADGSPCSLGPIDAVYTWVNGTDPRFRGQLAQLHYSLRRQSHPNGVLMLPPQIGPHCDSREPLDGQDSCLIQIPFGFIEAYSATNPLIGPAFRRLHHDDDGAGSHDSESTSRIRRAMKEREVDGVTMASPSPRNRNHEEEDSQSNAGHLIRFNDLNHTVHFLRTFDEMTQELIKIKLGRKLLTTIAFPLAIRFNHRNHHQYRAKGSVNQGSNNQQSSSPTEHFIQRYDLIAIRGLAIVNQRTLVKCLHAPIRQRLDWVHVDPSRRLILIQLTHDYYARRRPFLVPQDLLMMQKGRICGQERINETQGPSQLSIEHPVHLTILDHLFYDQQGYWASDGGGLEAKGRSLERDELAASRFADNDELRFSLRSIERYAPWIRHIYILTNGQIPAWLNLNHPKIRVVTHAHIFPNRSHLPTFSSPAIESHLHEIAGLSEHFLYFNDDVLLGKPIYPDDFFTCSTGYRVYLTWPVPDCAPGCPQSWLHDGYCDQPCNNSKCNWDAGDCLAVSTPQPDRADGGPAGHFAAGPHQSRMMMRPPAQPINSSPLTYCAPSCHNNWLADKFCDSVCNNAQCAYDLGDCLTMGSQDQDVPLPRLPLGHHGDCGNPASPLGSAQSDTQPVKYNQYTSHSNGFYVDLAADCLTSASTKTPTSWLWEEDELHQLPITSSSPTSPSSHIRFNVEVNIYMHLEPPKSLGLNPSRTTFIIGR